MNKLNVFSNKGGFRRLSKNTVYFFHNLKYAKQRVVRGFADCDIWDFSFYLKKLFSDGLDCIADDLHGYPESYGSVENWEKELRRIADLVRKLDVEEFERPDDYDEIKNEVLDWMRDSFDDLWD